MDVFLNDVVMLLPALFALLALGAFTGFCAGLLGIGGGIVLVPGLYFLFSSAWGERAGVGEDATTLMHIALATSMAIILPTGISSSWAQIKRKAVDFDAARLLAPGLVAGVIIGLLLVSRFDGHVLQFIFALGLYGVAASIAFRREDAVAYPQLGKKWIAYPASVVFGLAATFLGMGGAVLNVPYLLRAGRPLKTAIATASFLGVIVSLTATLGNLAVMGTGQHAGLIHFPSLAMIIPASVLMAPWGVKASHAWPVGRLKLAFAGLLVVVASRMLWDAL